MIERGLGRRYRFEQYTADPEGGIPFVKLKADSDDYPSRTMRITTLFNGFIFVKQYSQEICKDV